MNEEASEKAIGKVFRVVVSAMARPHEQSRSSPLRNMLCFFVEDATIYWLFSSSMSPLTTIVESAWFRDRIVADNFHTNVADKDEQVMHNSFIFMDSCVTK